LIFHIIVYIVYNIKTITNKTITNKTITNKTKMTNNNILSYFIKDIKDPIERAFYRQKNINNLIKIFYKNEILYDLSYYKLHVEIKWYYKNNIIIDYYRYSGRIINYKIDKFYKLCNTKYSGTKKLFYKKDKQISQMPENANYIYYTFICNKYLHKNNFQYLIDNKCLLFIRIKYFNGYINMYKSRIIHTHSYNYIQILIMNKYELHYYSRFFNIY
jgi:hypothetical protein